MPDTDKGPLERPEVSMAEIYAHRVVDTVGRRGALTEQIRRQGTCPGCHDGMVTRDGITVPCPLLEDHEGDKKWSCKYIEQQREDLFRCVTQAMRTAGVPERHLSVPEVKKTEAVSVVNKWDLKDFLVLCGAAGTGKSFAGARAVQRYLLSKAKSIRDFRMAVETAGRGVVWMRSFQIQDKDIRAKAETAPLLIFDDLGTEPGGPFQLSAVNDLVSARYDSMTQATVITTNLAVKDLRERYGVRLCDRLHELGYVIGLKTEVVRTFRKQAS